MRPWAHSRSERGQPCPRVPGFRSSSGGQGCPAPVSPFHERALERAAARNLTLQTKATSLSPLAGGRSSAWLEPQIVDLVVAGSNPVGHPMSCPVQSLTTPDPASHRPELHVRLWRFFLLLRSDRAGLRP